MEHPWYTTVYFLAKKAIA